VVNAVQGNGAWDSSLESSLRMALAWIGAVSLLTSLFWTMRLEEFTDALRGLRVPKTVAFAFDYAFRLLYASLHGIFAIIDALKLKGLELETKNPFTLLARLPKVMVPAVFTIVRRAAAMMAVLRMRGVTTGAGRPTLTLRRLRVADVAFLAVGLLAVAAAVASRFHLDPLA
jgi:energy-coupling factor transport system permease protein